MAGTRMLLTLNPKVYQELSRRAESNLMTVQQLITEILRTSVIVSKAKRKGGAPCEEPFLEYFSRK